MASAASLESAAARLRSEAARIETVIESNLDPVVVALPEMWIGPAADQLERDLLNRKAILRSVKGELRSKASQLDWEAAEIRATETQVVEVSPDPGVSTGAF